MANNSLGSGESESVTVTVNGTRSFLLKAEYGVNFLRVQTHMYSTMYVS